MHLPRIFILSIVILSSSSLFAQQPKKHIVSRKPTTQTATVKIKPLTQKNTATEKTIAERVRKPNKAALENIAF